MSLEENSEEKSVTKPKKHLLYSIFNPQGSGKEAEPEPDDDSFGFAKCFRLLKRNITKLLYVNLLIIFGNFPILFGVYALTGSLNDSTTTAASPLFGQLHGVMSISKCSPVNMALYGVHGFQTSKSIITNTTLIFFAIAILTLFTWGIMCTGTTYILRGIVRKDSIFFWSDFKGAIKRNFKQGFIVGILDGLLIAFLVYDIFFFYINGSTMFYVMIIIFAIYNMMRYYIYPLLITFDLSIWKIFKNSLSFVILGFKRNILAFLGSALLVALEYLLLGIFYPLGVMLPLFAFFSISAYFGVYSAWGKIKEIMIDPYVSNQN